MRLVVDAPGLWQWGVPRRQTQRLVLHWTQHAEVTRIRPLYYSVSQAKIQNP